jgi:DNA-binding response OmpR family regulator
MGQQDNLVYLVHCDSDVLWSFYEVLSAAGYEVAASTNARHALEYVARTKPRAVLCHWEMPELGGGEFLERSRRCSPETRIIMSSRHADGPMYEAVREQGGDDLLREPLSPIAVLHGVSRMLGLSVPYPSAEPDRFHTRGTRIGEGQPRRTS